METEMIQRLRDLKKKKDPSRYFYAQKQICESVFEKCFL